MRLPQSSQPPVKALTLKYANNGSYIDCFFIDIERNVNLAEYIEAFYTTPLFKAERVILAILMGTISSDLEASALAQNKTVRFAAWTIEARLHDQMLLCDITERTRSWLMIESGKNDNKPITRLYFGSVVTPKMISREGRATFGILFRFFGKFHILYSLALLRSAYRQLAKSA